MTQPKPRFDPAVLRRRAGETTFRRGEDYARDGEVALLLVEPDLVRAHVQGERLYRVELLGSGRTIEASCTCPAFARERGGCDALTSDCSVSMFRPCARP